MTNQILDLLDNLCYWQRLYIQEKLLNKTLSKDFLLETVGGGKKNNKIFIGNFSNKKLWNFQWT